MKKAGLYLTIAVFTGALLGLPLIIGFKVGSIISKVWFGFSIF